MNFSTLPDDIIGAISCYLEPPDMFRLWQSNPDNNKYQLFLGLSLSRNVCKILSHGSTDFHCCGMNNKTPLDSFREMVKKLPPKSVCIR
jgi:hypothetical protein